MSERVVSISLNVRPLSYMHQTALPTNCFIMLPQAISNGDPVAGVGGIIDTSWYGPDMLEKL